MKKNIPLILLFGTISILAFMLIGCSKKSYNLDSVKVNKEEKKSVDSTGHKKTVILDKSVITTEKTADTTIIINGKSLTGYIDPSKSKESESSINAHFENYDLSLDMTTDKKTGKTTATATPKPKIVPIKFNDKSTRTNNINTTSEEQSKLKSKSETTSDSLTKKLQKTSDPSVSITSLRTIVIWFLVIIALVGLIIYFGKKFLKKSIL